MAEYLDINGAKTLLTGVKKYINSNAVGGVAFDLTQFTPAVANFSETTNSSTYVTITVTDDVNLVYLTSDADAVYNNLTKELVIPENKEVLISIDIVLFDADRGNYFKINGKTMNDVFAKHTSSAYINNLILTAMYNGTNLILNFLGQYKIVTTANSNSYKSYVPINMIYVL